MLSLIAGIKSLQLLASTHGSPWQYDTYVPIVFAGMNIKPGRVSRKVLTVDIAPTLSNFLMIKPPSVPPFLKGQAKAKYAIM